MPSDFFGRFTHETCDSEDCSKIAKFLAKTTSHGHRLGEVDDDTDLPKKVTAGNELWLYSYDIEKKVQWKGKCRFCLLFSLIAMVWGE